MKKPTGTAESQEVTGNVKGADLRPNVIVNGPSARYVAIFAGWMKMGISPVTGDAGIRVCMSIKRK